MGVGIHSMGGCCCCCCCCVGVKAGGSGHVVVVVSVGGSVVGDVGMGVDTVGMFVDRLDTDATG